MSALSPSHQLQLATLLVLNDAETGGASISFEVLSLQKQSEICKLIFENTIALSNEESLLHQLDKYWGADASVNLCPTNVRVRLLSILAKLPPDAIDALAIALEQDSPSSSRMVRSRLFRMEYLSRTPDASVQTLMRELLPRHIKPTELHFLVRGQDEKVINKVFKNISRRNAEEARAGLEKLSLKVSPYTLELQQRLIDVALKLDYAGCIALYHGSSNPEADPLSPEILDYPSGRLMELRETLSVYEHYCDTCIQRILREIDNRTLATAMAIADDAVWNKFIGNCSTRLGEMIKNDMEHIIMQCGLYTSDLTEAVATLFKITDLLFEAGELDCSPTRLRPVK